MNRPLKQAVRDHFEQRMLSKDRLERLGLDTLAALGRHGGTGRRDHAGQGATDQ